MRTFSLIAILLTAIACATAADSNKVSETVEHTLMLGEHGTVSVANVNGPIRIDATHGDQVFLRAVKAARNIESLRATTIEIDVSEGRIAVETKLPKRSVFGRNADGVSVSYDLRIPRNASIQAESANGSIAIHDIQGELQAETVNGAIKLSAVTGPVSANTVNGSVVATYSSADDIGKNSLEAVNGSLQVWLPTEVTGKFRAATVNGSIKTDFPLGIRKLKYGRHQSVDDQLGESERTFSLKTVNGSIKIHKIRGIASGPSPIRE